MKNIFGTDGVRGVANTQISANFAMQLGKSFAVYITQSQQTEDYTICIGRDTRISGDMLCSAFVAGVLSMGVNVIDVGICPTPCVSYLVPRLKVNGGVVITASHNPSEFNGIKIMDCNGVKLDSGAEETISNIFYNITDYLCDTKVGSLIKDTETVKLWVKHLSDCVDNINLDGLDIVVDCASGAGYRVVPYTLRSLGANVTCLNCDNNGRNINNNCGSTCVDNLVNCIKRGKFHIGFAFDGDADRLVVVDNNGNVLTGDHLVYIIAKFLHSQGQLYNNTIVATVVSNHGLEHSLEALGINVVRTSVGDKFVLQQLLDNGYTLGAENSGHIILPQYNLCADGLLASLFLLKIIKASQKSLSQLVSGYQPYPTVALDVPVSARQHSLVSQGALSNSIDELIAELGDTGTLLVRTSGTQQVVRILVEGENLDLINHIAQKLQSLTLSL